MNASKVYFKTYNLINSCLPVIETEQSEAWRAQTYNTEYATLRNMYSDWRKRNTC